MAQQITNRLGGGLFVHLHQRQSKRSCTIRRRVSPRTEAIFENCRHAYLDRFRWDQVRESDGASGLPEQPRTLPKDGPRIVLVAQCQLSENSPRGRRFPSEPRAHETLTPQWKLKSSGSGFLQRCVRHPPWAHHQLGFGSGGYTGFAGTKPFRFGIWTFGRLWASKTSLSWMMPFR
jgi:hypothetical protein